MTASTNNYLLGKGILYFDRFDDAGLPTGEVDLGNCPAFSLQPTVETLDHFSSRSGLKVKDKSVTVQAGLTAKFTLEEFSLANLAMALLGTVTNDVIAILTESEIRGKLRFAGDPAAGPHYNCTLWTVTLKPTSEVGLITDDWGKIDFEAEVGKDETGHPTQPSGFIQLVAES